MRYVSTRGEAPVLEFDDVLLAGLARDGGLYVPERWPLLGADEIAGFAGLTYAELALRVITPFVGDRIAPAALAAMVEDAYAGFGHAAVAPLRQIGDNDWLMELFHGPTLAFKDYALQLIGRLFDHVLKARGERVTIVGATSGDTGSAAIAACRDRANLEIFMLHPKDRVSEVQRRQMTTVTAANVHNIAVAGTFDDCQALVKAMFADAAFRDALGLSAVNSINWARVMAQTVYYFAAAVALGAPRREVAFSVPTGNFGDVYAGYAARQMGLPVGRLVIATNRNDILARVFATGRYQTAEVVATLSPSMDIQVASNFERLLFDLHDRDGARVARLMDKLAAHGGFAIDAGRLEAARAVFTAHRLDDDETAAEIARIHRETGMLVDPHTAIGVAAGRACRGDRGTPMVALATADAAKFPDAVERATGVRPALPPRLADLFERPECQHDLPNDLAAVQALIRETTGHRRLGKGAA
ncbi:MAG: threonine synthase [Alphaproteobacteria bacterium]